DQDILDQAIRLGSLVEKDPASDLGKFGMGLCTASMSICRQTTVITKAAGGEMLTAINDIDEVKRLNDFVSHLDSATSEDNKLFEGFLPGQESGTIILLRKCDNLQNKNVTNFANTLSKHLSRIFRYFISSGTRIFINDTA